MKSGLVGKTAFPPV